MFADTRKRIQEAAVVDENDHLLLLQKWIGPTDEEQDELLRNARPLQVYVVTGVTITNPLTEGYEDRVYDVMGTVQGTFTQVNTERIGKYKMLS